MKWARRLLAALVVLTAIGARAEPYRLGDIDPSAKAGYYTPRILRFLDNWPPPTASLRDARSVLVRGVRSRTHPDVVGIVKHFTIDKPLSEVIVAGENFAKFPAIWSDVLSVKVVSRDGNRTLTDWVRKAPAFFLPQLRYRMEIVSDHSSPDRAVYRYQFVSGPWMKSSDTVVVYEKVAENQTRVSVLLFIDPDFGVFRALVESKIWRHSLENSFKDDIAFRAHVEHPDWTSERLARLADEECRRHPFDPIEYTDLLKIE